MILYEQDYEWQRSHLHRTLELEIIDELFILKIHWKYNRKYYNGGNVSQTCLQICLKKEEFEGILELMYQALIEEMKKE